MKMNCNKERVEYLEKLLAERIMNTEEYTKRIGQCESKTTFAYVILACSIIFSILYVY